MDNVADQPDLGFEQLLLLGSLGKQFLLLRLNVGWEISARRAIQINPVAPTFLLQEIGNVLLGLYSSVRIRCSRGLATAHAFFLGPICFWTSLIRALS